MLYNKTEHLNDRGGSCRGPRENESRRGVVPQHRFPGRGHPAKTGPEAGAPALPPAGRPLPGEQEHAVLAVPERAFSTAGKAFGQLRGRLRLLGRVQYYYPTYQSLSDQELRGYFAWRTRLRRGEIGETSLSFAFLYIYELINQIGAADPMDGYRKLRDFRDAYGRIDGAILPYLNQWLVDYVVYYGLDAELLAGSSQVLFDRSVAVLEQAGTEEPERVIAAVKQLSPKWLGRSRFYADHREDMDAVIVRVLRRMAGHYAARCKKSLVEQYFGSPGRYQARPFEAAVFCDPLKRRSYEYAVDERCICRCENGVWSVDK